MTTIGTNEKTVPIIDHKLTEVIQEIQNNFGGDVKLVLSVNSGTSTITQAKELGAPAKVEEIKPLEDKNDEGIEIEAE